MTLSKPRHEKGHPEWGGQKIGFENLRLKKNTQLHWKFSVSLRNTTRFGPKKKKDIGGEKPGFGFIKRPTRRRKAGTQRAAPRGSPCGFAAWSPSALKRAVSGRRASQCCGRHGPGSGSPPGELAARPCGPPARSRAVSGRQSDVAGGSGGWGGGLGDSSSSLHGTSARRGACPSAERESVCMRVCARAQVCLPT